MGLMDKFKNLFTDEEIIEEEEIEPVEIKEVKKEEEVNKLPTFMREKIEKEEKKVNKMDAELEIKKEIKLENKLEHDVLSDISFEEKNTNTNSFKFPLSLSDSDFVETRSRQSIHHKKPEIEVKENIEVTREARETVRVERPTSVKKETKEKVKVADIYKDKKVEQKEVDKKFRVTPIISPIYGVLDQNYTPVDMENTVGENFEERRPSKSVDFDSVRKKAYGNLSKEIKENLMCENCEYLKEAKECKKEKNLERYQEQCQEKYQKQYQERYEEKYQKTPSNLLYDVLEDNEDKQYNKYKDITLDEATENYYDYGVEYEKVPIHYDEEVAPKREIKEEVVREKKEIPPVKSSINLLSTLKKSMGDKVDEPSSSPKKDLELTDDLFNLIDSMYDERNETK